MAAVKIKNLSFRYPAETEYALKNVSLAVEPGELVLLCGRSGGGKSTLLRLLKKELAPHGEINGSIDVSGGEIGFVAQNVQSNMVTDTVLGELAFQFECRGYSNQRISLMIAQTASYFNLNNYINSKTALLPGGVKQLLALACASCVGPDILLLDEPCSQLDPVAAENFRNAVLRLNRERGVTVLVSDHSAGFMRYADKALLLEGGAARFYGSPQQLAQFCAGDENGASLLLPPYTRLLPSRTLSFARAREEIKAVKEKPFTEPQPPAAAVKLRSLAFAYEKKLPDVLFALDYTAYSGRLNALVGANGSGKTTLLKCAAGLLKPYGGRIKLSGKTAYMPQSVQNMFVCDTVGEEINDPALLEKYALSRLASRSPFDISGGEAQRLALARVEAAGADIILLDEPTKGVDPIFKPQLAHILRGWCAAGKTVIFSTHDLEFAGRFADYAAFLFGGAIVAEAPRRSFFSALDIYTTSLCALSGGRIVSIDDAEAADEK